MAAKPRDQDKYNWQDVYTYSTIEVYDYKRGIPPTKGKKGGREGSFGGVNIIEGDLKTKTRLDDLLEKYKDLNHVYVNNRLEEYDDLVQYYTILHIKQHMEDSNVELDEWWELEKHN